MLANNALQARFETVRETYSFDNLDTLDTNVVSLSTFGAEQPVGIIYIDVYNSSYNITVTPGAEMKFIRLVACWRQKGGRVIGEDSNLDGSLDLVTEDDGNRIMDSPAELIALITKVL